MSSIVRRSIVCLCIFLPLLWVWLAAPTYTARGRDPWRMPGPLGSSIFDDAGAEYASLDACLANPSLLSETFFRYGRGGQTAPSSNFEDKIRYMHGLYAMDTIRQAMLRKSQVAVQRTDYFTAVLAAVGTFKNACMKTVWIALRGPADYAVHGLVGLVFLAAAIALHFVLRRHV